MSLKDRDRRPPTHPYTFADLELTPSGQLIATLRGANRLREQNGLARIGTMHLLYQAAETDPVIKISLAAQGITPEMMVKSHLLKKPEALGDHPQLSDPAESAFSRSVQIALDEGTTHISSRHLVLGIMRTDEGFAAGYLRIMEVNPFTLESQMDYEELKAVISDPTDRLVHAISNPALEEVEREAIRDLARVIGAI